MEKTPISLRKHIALIGNSNAGKSTLFNALLGQDASIVSDICGTTTDPVVKPIELVPYGPVALIDTAGLSDGTALGELRMKKTAEILSRTDLILHIADVNGNIEELPHKKIASIRVFTKCDTADSRSLEQMKATYPDAVFISEYSQSELERLKTKIISELEKQQRDDETLLGNLVPQGSNVVMVVPIDSAAPKGRLILPQVQAIRDCLDHNIRAVVTKPETLNGTLSELKHIELVVTDSQAFKEVSELVPSNIPLTSFSMLLANQKGQINQLIDGTKAIPSLCDGDQVLFLESCTHSTTHDDIGKVKIPNLLLKKTGKSLHFTHVSGYDIPDNVDHFKLIIQCGGCMINKREIQSRLQLFESKNIPVTNYGVILAYLSAIVVRPSEIFNR